MHTCMRHTAADCTLLQKAAVLNVVACASNSLAYQRTGENAGVEDL